MLNRIDLVLKNKNINRNMGSIFAGYLMSIIDRDYVEYLHHLQLNPYTSYVYFDKKENRYVWRINTLDKIAKEMIIDRVLVLNEREFLLENQNINVEVEKFVRYPEADYSTLYLDEEKKNKIIFNTPTSFKSQGVYQIFPQVDLILNSVVRKINEFSEEIKIEEQSVIDSIISKTSITSYTLRSTKYHLEKVRISSFIGDLYIKNFSNEEYEKIFYFIMKVMNYTGVGIKTSLGMGGVKVE
jgi:CRISPR-associated endoribonuclease Cas6